MLTEAIRTAVIRIRMIEPRLCASAPAKPRSGPLILMAWLSPAFPVGGFAFSHGLEWAYEAGHVVNRSQLQEWLLALLQSGSGWNDAVLLAASWRAVRDGEGLDTIIALGAALQPSSERFLEATVQGKAFFLAVKAAWSHKALAIVPEAMMERLTYPVAVGIAAAAHGIDLEETLAAFLQAFCANLISASVRLGIVGQTDGQRIMATLVPAVAATAEKAQRSTQDDLGTSTLRADMMSLHHETQYSRLFRS
jgi:urease accessory protein